MSRPIQFEDTGELVLPKSGYGAVLAVPGVWRLLVSAVVGRLPIGSSSLAILLLVREQTGSFGLAGITVGAFALTGAIAAPIQGRLLDRFGPRRVLPPFAVSQALVLAALVPVVTSGATDAAIVLIAAAAGALVPPISASVRVLWPEIVPTPEGVESAYALDATAQELIWTAGPLIVAVSIAVASPAAAVFVTAAILLAGTAIFVTSPPLSWWPDQEEPDSRAGALASRPLRILLLATMLAGLGIGTIEVGLPALAVAVGSASAGGILLAAWSVGSMTGGIAYGARKWSSPVDLRFAVLLTVGAVALLPLIFTGSLTAAILLTVLAGFPTAAWLSCLYVLVGREAPAGTMAEAFTWSLAALITGIAIGSAIAGQLVDSHGAGRAFLLGAVVTSLAGLVAFASARTMR
ncbi:MAG: MFS transporter [Solirubrobacterales bacterium]|nr:MFS transporter [Solirubrobacterales bacterium]